MGPGGRRGDFGFDWSEWCGPGGTGGAWFWPGQRGHGGRRRGAGFRARVFDRGDLKYMILRLVKDKPMHGYEIMQALEEESGGWYSPSPGTVYPALQLLQDQGYLESDEQDGKRVYRITEAGRAFLEKHSDRVDDVLGRVSEFTDRFSGEGMGDLTRTFVRFAQVTWEEAMRRSRDPARMGELREIIERATREMRAAQGR